MPGMKNEAKISEVIRISDIFHGVVPLRQESSAQSRSPGITFRNRKQSIGSKTNYSIIGVWPLKRDPSDYSIIGVWPLKRDPSARPTPKNYFSKSKTINWIEN